MSAQPAPFESRMLVDGKLVDGQAGTFANVNPATEALYIANPLSKRGISAMFSTHPPMEERIRRLRELDAAAGIE